MIASPPIQPLPDVKLPELRQIGKPLRRVDAMGKAVGATVYAGDFSMPQMLHAKVFRSTQASARVVRLDVSRARSLPGVVCVLTAADLPDSRVSQDIPGQTGQKARAGSEVPILASDSVRYYGEPLALVAAETLDIAEAALRLIEVEYAPLPGVYDPLEALKPGAPLLVPPDPPGAGLRNAVARWKIRKGDLAAGFADADLVIENTFRLPYQEHAYIEPEAGVAWIDERGVINIRVSTQVIEHFRNIAKAVGVPQSQIRIQGTMVGGGFGGKEDVTVEIYLALLTKTTNRPVKLVYTREESIFCHSKRHPYVITHRTGVKRDGRITAAAIDIVADSGAYAYLSPYVLLYTTVMAAGPYRVPNLRVDSVAVATNNPFTSAFRGFGGPQACFAYEQQMDAIADALGVDRYELRRINYLRLGDTISTGQPIETAAWLEETATRALAALEARSSKLESGSSKLEAGNQGLKPHSATSSQQLAASFQQPASSNQLPVKIGRGVASYFQSYGRLTWLHDTSQAWVGMEQDGTVVVRAGVPDLGAGQINSLCQIAAEVLGVPLERVLAYATDSALTPLSGTTTATRQLYMSGNATLMAATAVRKVLLERASKYFEEDAESLDLADSRAFVRRDPSQAVELSSLAKVCASEGLPLANLALFKAPFTDPIDPETGQGRVFADFTFGAYAVEVAVDTETGEVTVLKAAACHDVGRAINWAAAEGQIAGGGMQGLGYALMENLIVKDGIIQTPSLSEYLIPTSMDFPTTQVIILESGTGVGPFGAKGIGEPALTPAPSAVASAVSDALGVPIHELPITPGRVLAAVDAARRGA
ncbi:MAG: xanthine dehydrogenase family protein molybdopterin-binding subunit [Chloroflexi bacterium]|nr:xanthine dehydrogenase family protein molybdopterin-binding subunit [Chloroflexota bacterium]